MLRQVIVSGALLLGCASAQASQSGAGLGASQEASLAMVAPELHDAARKAMQFSRMLGHIDDKRIAELRRSGGPTPPPFDPDVSVEQKMIPGPRGAPDVKIFVINAKPGTSRPGILHTHGGGFILGTAETDVRRLQEMARQLDCVIVTVEYRLSPETRYPGPVEDNYAGLRWLYDNASGLGLDRGRIAVMGESAGGGHAALLALTARDRKEIPIAFQLLVYPMLDDRTGGSVKLPPHIGAVGWSAAENQYGWSAFLGQKPGSKAAPGKAVPARAQDLTGLPPTFIEVGAIDLFVAEDMEYARRLIAAGVPTGLLVVPGAFHGFEGLAPETPLARQFMAARVDALRRAFYPKGQ